jgi:MFS family permease
MFGQVAFLVHQVNLVQSIAGIGTASLLVGITGVFGIASRLLGWLGDRVSRSNLLACYCGVQSIAFLLAGWSTSIVLLAIASGIVGLSMGNVVALQPLLMGDRFGLPSLGALFGSSTFVTQCGSAAGIFVCGSLAGRTGSYSISFSIAGILALIATGLAIASGRIGRDDANGRASL